MSLLESPAFGSLASDYTPAGTGSSLPFQPARCTVDLTERGAYHNLMPPAQSEQFSTTH